MAENTAIEWTDHTFNPWEGCQKVGPGCDHCYAETRNARFAGGMAINWGPGAPRRRTSAANWRKPIQWNKAHAEFFAQHGRRQRVFCASLADVFDNAVDPKWRRELFSLILDTPNLDWLLLTKRIGNVRGMVPLPWVSKPFQHGPDPTNIYPAGWPDNVWIGATIVNQEEADRDIPKLLEVPARVRFLSMEPLLGPVTLFDMDGPIDVPDGSQSRLHWVIVGGESGASARPMHPQWSRSLRDQCAAVGVPFLFKQHGEWMPAEREGGTVTLRFANAESTGPKNPDWFEWPDGLITACVGKKAAGRQLDGRTHDEFPRGAK